MTQHDAILDLFRRHGNKITLGQIMQTTLAAEYRARFTELRRKGYVIALERGKKPSDNQYQIVEPDGNQMRFA